MRGEVDRVSNVERSHVRIGGSEGPNEVSTMILIHCRNYLQVCGYVDRCSNLMEARGLPICAGDGAAGDIFIQR